MAVSDLIAASIAALFFTQPSAAPAARPVVDAPCAPLPRLVDARRSDGARLWAPIGCADAAPRLSVTGLMSWATGYDPGTVIPNAGEQRTQVAVHDLPDVTDPDRISRIVRLIVVDLRGKDAGLELDRKELSCLQRALYFEARGEGMLGQAAVAHVALNRVNSRPTRTTICDVVTEAGQFAPYLNGEPD